MTDKVPLTIEQILAQYGIRMEDSPTGKRIPKPKPKKEDENE